MISEWYPSAGSVPSVEKERVFFVVASFLALAFLALGLWLFIQNSQEIYSALAVVGVGIGGAAILALNGMSCQRGRKAAQLRRDVFLDAIDRGR